MKDVYNEGFVVEEFMCLYGQINTSVMKRRQESYHTDHGTCVQASMGLMADRLAQAKTESFTCKILLKWWVKAAVRRSQTAMGDTLSRRRGNQQLAAAWWTWCGEVHRRRREESSVAGVESGLLRSCFRDWSVLTARSYRKKMKELQDALPAHSAHASARGCDAEATAGHHSTQHESIGQTSHSQIRDLDPNIFQVDQQILADACEYLRV
jgi:hypothetical protein